MTKALISALLAFGCLGAPVAAATYACTTQKFTTFQNDAAFEAGNLKKTFTLEVSRRAVTAVSQSATFSSSTTRYKITKRAGTQAYGVHTDEFAQWLIALPLAPQEVLQRRGSFPVTLVRQSDMSVNSWLLACTAP